tara:strand:+ start:1045 stop:1392 length:348 start_codon:yes stop_codon:yes gene_type:complete
MTDLIACLTTGKGTWGAVNAVMQAENWKRTFLITNEFGKENFKGNAELIVVDTKKSLKDLSQEIYSALHKQNLDLEVAVNMQSGSGNEHMALLAALLKLGVGIRLVYEQEGMQTL